MLINLARIAPKYIQNSSLWLEYLAACSQELNLLLNDVQEYKDYYVPTTYSHVDRLVDLCKNFGDTPNMVLANKDSNWSKYALNHAIIEADSLAFKIMNKGTYRGLVRIFSRARKNGKLFIMYHDNARLRRAVDFDTTLTALQAYQEGTVFNGISPYREFTDLQKNLNTFDKVPLLIFDDDENPWTFDYNTAFYPTTAIAMEYDITKIENWEGKECLLNPAYFQFLETDVEKTREATTIPYNGVHLDFVVNSMSPFFNKMVPYTDYTIPAIKAQYGITPFFKKKTSENTAHVDFDNTSLNFDSETRWYFDGEDSSYELKEPRDLFYRYVFGTGKAQMLSQEYASLYEGMLMCLYWQDVDQVFLDLSPNRLHEDDHIYFNEKPFYTPRFPTVMGGNPDFQDDMDHILNVERVIFESTTDKTWTLRIKQNTYSESATVLHYGGASTNFDLKVFWNNTSKKYEIQIDGVVEAESQEIAEGDDTRITMYFDNTSLSSPKLSVVAGSVETLDIGLPGVLEGDETMTLFGTTSPDIFTGIIYDIRVYSRLLDSTEILGIDCGIFSHIENPCYYGEQQMYSLSDSIGGYEAIQAFANTNTVKDVYIGYVYAGSDTFSFQLPYGNIKPGTFKLEVEGFGIPTYDVKDDKFGLLESIDKAVAFYSGTINYDTGAVVFNTYQQYRELDIDPVIHEESGSAEYTLNLGRSSIVPGTIQISIVYDGVAYDYIQDEDTGEFWVFDSGSGNRYFRATDSGVGGGFDTFELDTDTGDLHIVRDSVFNVYSTQILDVNIKNLTIIDTDYRVKVFYQTTQPIEITEAAILDNENVPVVYASFPPIISDSIYSHVSLGWFINFIRNRLDGFHSYNEDVYNYNE